MRVVVRGDWQATSGTVYHKGWTIHKHKQHYFKLIFSKKVLIKDGNWVGAYILYTDTDMHTIPSY